MHHLSHFAINADDTERAQRFYGAVFGWQFEPLGPPQFFRIHTGQEQPGILGALQQRRELVPGKSVNGFECTIAVTDVDAVRDAVIANGGQVVMEKTRLPGVGELIFFEDSEGNLVGAMHYERDAP